jgi:chemotaxis regulatin CheY-phosphate phosphatase CheZ
MANLPVPSPLNEADYEAIESAVMETARGRWFLAEYARRNRNADTTMLLKALDRIEASIGGKRSVEPVDRIRFDLVEMSKAISRTKAEIASIKPDADDHGKFGEASEELDSVVMATEKATSDILACAERIQEIAWTLREQGVESEVCDLLDANATEIYTGCSFQDITGQRTRKVIQVLRYLEERINAMIGIWGLDGAMAAEAAEQRAVDGDKALLNGPAKPGTGLDQADVDMVMGPAADAHRRSAAPPLVPSHAPAEPMAPRVAAAHVIEAEVIDTEPVELEARAIDGDVIEAEPVDAEVVEADGVEADVVAAPVAAAPAPRPASDPLAPIMALSAEEKIALFT